MRSPMRSIIAALALCFASLWLFDLGRLLAATTESTPAQIRFTGPGGVTLVGYLFEPLGDAKDKRPADAKDKRPAVVMMHGRAGAYSTAAHGTYDATTLSQRHLLWGRRWAAQGYIALLVDSFGPRGFSEGFPIHSYSDRPEAVNEVTVRPHDAYAALAYLRTRPDVDTRRVGLQGWSNGGSAALATMATSSTEDERSAELGFVGALAFYPACGLHDKFVGGYITYAPVRVFIGDADEEVSFGRCRDLVEGSRRSGGDIAITIYPGATHGFDEPGRRRQTVEANARAAEEAGSAALTFMRERFAQ